jgi:uracil-DNA glycosylase
MTKADQLFQAIQADPQNKSFTDKEIMPLYHVISSAEILIISQAPSRKAQQSMVFWDDPSGDRLRFMDGAKQDCLL